MSNLQQHQTHSDDKSSDTTLHKILKKCATLSSYESLTTTPTEFGDMCPINGMEWNNCYRRMSFNSQALSESFSSHSSSSDDTFIDKMLEEHGRISLAYENLERIPQHIAEKFAPQTKCLDLSYNNFQNLTFLTYFEDLHTLILDRNIHLEVHTLPYLPNLKILWINNCNIGNLTEWIQRIEKQCPALEQLSMMGNLGIKKEFSYFSTAPFTGSPISMVTDCRTYVLDILPNLQYLDGIPRSNLLTESQKQTYNSLPSADSGSFQDDSSKT